MCYQKRGHIERYCNCKICYPPSTMIDTVISPMSAIPENDKFGGYKLSPIKDFYWNVMIYIYTLKLDLKDTLKDNHQILAKLCF